MSTDTIRDNIAYAIEQLRIAHRYLGMNDLHRSHEATGYALTQVRVALTDQETLAASLGLRLRNLLPPPPASIEVEP